MSLLCVLYIAGAATISSRTSSLTLVCISSTVQRIQRTLAMATPSLLPLLACLHPIQTLSATKPYSYVVESLITSNSTLRVNTFLLHAVYGVVVFLVLVACSVYFWFVLNFLFSFRGGICIPSHNIMTI